MQAELQLATQTNPTSLHVQRSCHQLTSTPAKILLMALLHSLSTANHNLNKINVVCSNCNILWFILTSWCESFMINFLALQRPVRLVVLCMHVIQFQSQSKSTTLCQSVSLPVIPVSSTYWYMRAGQVETEETESWNGKLKRKLKRKTGTESWNLEMVIRSPHMRMRNCGCQLVRI